MEEPIENKRIIVENKKRQIKYHSLSKLDIHNKI